MPKVKISGPISYTYLEVGDKKIHLFGDNHANLKHTCKSKNSVDIVDFLKNKFKSTKQPIDFFVEQDYETIQNNYKIINKTNKKYNPKKSPTYLEKVRDTFLRDYCFRKNKNICNKKYPNVRFHAGDYRDYKEVWCKIIRALYLELIKLVDANSPEYALIANNNRTEIKKYLEFLFADFNTLPKILLFFDKCMKTKKIKDQFNKIDTKYKTKIKLYIKEIKTNFKKHNKKYKYHIKCLKKTLYDPESNIHDIQVHLYWIFDILWGGGGYGKQDDIFCLIMDSYMLARMMKNEYNNIIVYAGEKYILNYIYFFKKYLKAKEKSTSKNKSLRCIEIKDFNFN